MINKIHVWTLYFKVRQENDISKNGRVGSSKGAGPQGKIEKSSKNSQNQLFQSSGKQRFTATKQTLNEWKGNLKMVGKHCGVFVCLWPILLLGSAAVLKMTVHVPSLGLWSLVLEEAEQTLFVCSNLCRDYLKDWCKVLVFVSPNSELTQGGTPYKTKKKPAATCGKWLSGGVQWSAKILGGKARESLFEKSGNSKALVNSGIWKVMHMLRAAHMLRKDLRGFFFPSYFHSLSLSFGLW